MVAQHKLTRKSWPFSSRKCWGGNGKNCDHAAPHAFQDVGSGRGCYGHSCGCFGGTGPRVSPARSRELRRKRRVVSMEANRKAGAELLPARSESHTVASLRAISSTVSPSDWSGRVRAARLRNPRTPSDRDRLFPSPGWRRGRLFPCWTLAVCAGLVRLHRPRPHASHRAI